MPYNELAYFHLATVVPAFLLGSYLLVSKSKGTPKHRFIGKIYMLLMLITAVITLFMPTKFGPSLAGHFGFIHFFSALVLYNVPAAYLAIKKGDIKRHRGLMIGLYIGGILIAGGFAFTPDRMLYNWLFA